MLPPRVTAPPFSLPDEPHLLHSLPFIRETTHGERSEGLPPVLYWSVQPSGDYKGDCEMGERFAHLAHSYMIRENFPLIMVWAVLHMISFSEHHTGIEVGFLSVFAEKSFASAPIELPVVNAAGQAL